MVGARSFAAAQTIPRAGDVAHNVRQHVELARLAAGAGAGVVVFPELSLTGYEVELAPKLAFSEDDARLEPLRDAAAALDITLVVGAPVRLRAALQIGAFLLGPGRAPSLYTKQHLGAFPSSASVDGVVPPGEPTVFTPGTRDPLLELAGTTAAVAICADIGHASHPRAAAARGAKAYLASMFVIPSEFEGDRARLERYATEHALCVVFSNYGAPTGGLRSAGQSAIWSDQGERVAALGATGAGIVVASVHDGTWHHRTCLLG